MLKRTIGWTLGIVLGGAILAGPLVIAEQQPQSPAEVKPATSPETKKEGAKETKWAPAVQPKPLSDNVKRGLAWLVEHQLKDGAWGQGEESSNMGGGGKMRDMPSVADTCMAALALIRAGSTPAKGDHAKNVLEAVKFVCNQIEQSDKDSLYITPTRGTRVQSKLGTYIDTFTASLLLAEVDHQMPDEESQNRVSTVLDKLLGKIQKNQRADGTWDGHGWATTLQQGMAVKGLNRAMQGGRQVDAGVQEKAEKKARDSFDRSSGKFSAEGSAGVGLYAAGSNLNAMAQSVKTNKMNEKEVRGELAAAKSEPQRQAAKAKLDRFKNAEEDLAAANAAVIAKLDDKQFVAGFGSNGGEEFLSYMNIGESLVVKGGVNWKSWDKSITENLNRVQNKDGSWSGHHCITGRTFCTSAALLALMIDRSPQPITEKMKQR